MTKNLIAPSILSADFANMGEAVTQIAKNGLDWVHCDVMDGVYVPNITFGMPMVKAIRSYTALPLDVHLMIVEPEKYALRFIEAGADIVTFHKEASKDAKALLCQIREKGKKAGLVLNPDKQLSELDGLYEYLDIVVIMGVFPGYSGQKLIPEALNKLEKLSRLIQEKGYDITLEFDGGVRNDNAALIKSLGADVLVAGSSYFDAPDKSVAAKALKLL